MGNCICAEPLYVPQTEVITYVRFNALEPCNVNPDLLHVLDLPSFSTVFLHRRIYKWKQLERMMNQWLDDLEPYRSLRGCCRRSPWVLDDMKETRVEDVRWREDCIGIHSTEISFKMIRADEFMTFYLGTIFSRDLCEFNVL